MGFLVHKILWTHGAGVSISPNNLSRKNSLTLTKISAPLYLRRLVSLNLTLGSGIFSIEVCRMIYATQVVFGGILMACAQSFLMLRG